MKTNNLTRNLSIFNGPRFLTILFFLTVNTVFPQTFPDELQAATSFSSPENLRAPYELPPSWTYQTQTDNPHFIIVMLGANPRINNIPLLPGDFIGAFYTDNTGQRKCGGADFWLGNENIIFPCFRDDPATPQKDGFSPAETIYFRLFSWTTQKEYNVSLIAFDPSFATTDKWYPLGLSSVINIAAFTTFDAYATATPNPICIGDFVTLSANIFVGTTGNYTYAWTSNPPGLSSNLQTVIHTPGVNTTYFLTVSDGSNTSQHSILVNVNTPPWISPGPDKTICTNQTTSVTAFPENNSGILWSTAGDGTFNNPSLVSPVYTPGSADKTNGSVVLTATALPKSPCQQTASANLTITLTPIASVSLPASMPACRSQEIWITATAANYSSLQWTSNGDGTITNPNSPTTRYIPGSFDLSLGYFTLTCCVNSISPRAPSSCAQTLVTLINPPTVSSPSSRKRCENITVPLTAVANNYSSVLWTTAGDGTFSNPNILNPSYNAGPNDKLNGGTIVTVTAFGNSACLTFPSTSNTTIILDPLPRLNPGNTGVFCKGFPLQMNATAQYYGSLSWSTSGDGNFSSTAVLNPIYYPGPNDLANNAFNLTLSATALTSCTGSVSAVLPVTLVAGTTAQILTPTGQQRCVGEPMQLSATASGYTSLQWTTTGDGIFNNPMTLNPVYTPGSNDNNGAAVQLKLTAFAPANCGSNSVKTIQVTFNLNLPVVNAGNDATITEPAVFTTNPTVSFYTSLVWQTSGDGQFSNPNTLITNYYPGIQDLQNGTVQLTLSATGQGSCAGPVTDHLTLTIIRKHTINLAAGWQGLSSFVAPVSGNFDQLMSQISGQLVIAQNFLELYWPEYGINTIGIFSNQHGYQVKLAAPATLIITGSDVNPKTLSLDNNWNIMPVLSGCTVAYPAIIGQLGSKLVIIKEIGGTGMIWPGQGIYTISHFLPGKAYMVKLTEPSTITFPACTNP